LNLRPITLVPGYFTAIT